MALSLSNSLVVLWYQQYMARQNPLHCLLYDNILWHLLAQNRILLAPRYFHKLIHADSGWKPPSRCPLGLWTSPHPTVELPSFLISSYISIRQMGSMKWMRSWQNPSSILLAWHVSVSVRSVPENLRAILELIELSSMTRSKIDVL